MGTISGIVTSLAVTALTIRALGVADYGLLIFALSTATLASSPGRVILAQGITRSIAALATSQDAAGIQNTIRATLTLSWITSGLGALSVIVVVGLTATSLPWALRLWLGVGISLYVLGTNSGIWMTSIARGMGRMIMMEAPPAVLGWGRLAGTAVLFLLTAGSIATFSGVHAVTGILGAATALVLLKRLIPKVTNWWVFDAEAAWKLFRELEPFAVMSLVGILLTQLPVVMLGLTHPPSSVGGYEPILRVVEQGMLLISLLMVPAYLPVATALSVRGEREVFSDLYVRISKVTYAMTVPIALLLTLSAETVLRPLFGSELKISFPILAILIGAFLLNSALGFNGTALIAVGDRKDMKMLSLTSMGLCVAITVVLVPLYGAFGAAVATGLSYLFMNGYASWLLFRATGTSVFRADMVKVLFLSVAGIAGAFYLRESELLRLFHPVIWSGALIVAFMVAVVVTRGISQSEVRELVRLQPRNRRSSHGDSP